MLSTDKSLLKQKIAAGMREELAVIPGTREVSSLSLVFRSFYNLNRNLETFRASEVSFLPPNGLFIGHCDNDAENANLTAESQ